MLYGVTLFLLCFALYILRLVHTYTNSLETLSLRPLSLEDTFPMGGYFNEFRREGVSAALVLELRVAVRAAIIQSGGDAGCTGKLCQTAV